MRLAPLSVCLPTTYSFFHCPSAFWFLSYCPCCPVVCLPDFLVRLSACVSVCPGLFYLSCLRSTSRRQNTHPITTQSLSQHPPPYFFFLLFSMTSFNKARLVRFLPVLISSPAPAPKGCEPGCRRWSLLAAIFPEHWVSDESGVDSGSGSSNAARQLLQKHNYPNTRTGCRPVSWLAGEWDGHSRRGEKEAGGPETHTQGQNRRIMGNMPTQNRDKKSVRVLERNYTTCKRGIIICSRICNKTLGRKQMRTRDVITGVPAVRTVIVFYFDATAGIRSITVNTFPH